MEYLYLVVISICVAVTLRLNKKYQILKKKLDNEVVELREKFRLEDKYAWNLMQGISSMYKDLSEGADSDELAIVNMSAKLMVQRLMIEVLYIPEFYEAAVEKVNEIVDFYDDYNILEILKVIEGQYDLQVKHMLSKRNQ